jgi:phosphoserine phosphatase RsbU/P
MYISLLIKTSCFDIIKINDIFVRLCMASTIKDKKFVNDIIDGMYDWVRVIDKDFNMVYVNKPMTEALGNSPEGKKCYTAIGKESACENCISRGAIFDGKSHVKEEIIGDKTFSVMSSPLRNSEGEIIAAVEVLRDVTEMKALQKKVMDQNRKLKFDLNLARKLQCSLLPKALPEEKIAFSFIYKPCETIGGDFLDIFKIDEDHIGIYIADVSGHGVSASMLTVFLRASINKKLLSPAEVLSELFIAYNSSSISSDLYITIFYAVINLKTKTIVFSNAGHNVCPIIFNDQKFEILRVPGIPISTWLEKPEYVDRYSNLAVGDSIFFYTDGIIEMRNAKNEQYGEKRLLDTLLLENSSPKIILNKIVDSACQFSGIIKDEEIPDDITMALLKIK